MELDSFKLELTEYIQLKLNSLSAVKDEFGNIFQMDIFEGKLVTALELASKDLKAVNVDETSNQFSSLIVSLACYHLLIAQSIKEKARNLDSLGDLLFNIAHAELEKFKYFLEFSKKQAVSTPVTYPTYPNWQESDIFYPNYPSYPGDVISISYPYTISSSNPTVAISSADLISFNPSSDVVIDFNNLHAFTSVNLNCNSDGYITLNGSTDTFPVGIGYINSVS